MKRSSIVTLATGGAAVVVAAFALVALPARSQAPAPDAAMTPPSVATVPPMPDPFAMKGIFQVRDYGATGNGQTDDTEAIQRAIDAAERVHGVVGLNPPSGGGDGRYLVTHPLVINTGVAVEGLSRNTTILVRRLDFDVFSIVGGPNVEISHFRIVGDKDAPGVGGNGFHIQHSQAVFISNVTMNGLWSGTLNESSGNVRLFQVAFAAADRAPDPSHPRFGLKATASLERGNSNLTSCTQCGVTDFGPAYPRTVDGFVLANGYNSLTLTSSGALQANRTVWVTADGGRPPNFLVLNDVTSDHSNVGIELDEGSAANIFSTLVTSAPGPAIHIARTYAGGPVTIANSHIIATAQGIDIEGGRTVTISGGEIATVGRGDGIRVGSNGQVTISGVGISAVRQGAGLHVLPQHAGGWLTVSGISVNKSAYGVVVDPGTSGGYTITGNSFTENSGANVRDGGSNPRKIIQSNSSS